MYAYPLLNSLGMSFMPFVSVPNFTRALLSSVAIYYVGEQSIKNINTAFKAVTS